MGKAWFHQLPSGGKRIWTISRKELIQLWRDRFSLILIFIMPLVTIMIYGFAVRILITEVPIVVQDFDHTPLSRAYVEQLAATNRLQIISLPETTTNGKPGSDLPVEALDQGIAKAAVIIPPQFANRIEGGTSSQIQVLIDGTDVNNSRAIRSYIRAITAFFLQQQGLQPAGSSLISAQVRLWSNYGGRESHFIVPGVYALVLWVYPSMVAALSMSREKEQGTILQIYASNLKGTELILGKAFAYFLVGLLQTLVVMVAGSLLFDLHFMGDPIPLLIGTPIYLSSSVIFGVLLGIRANSRIVAIQSITLTGYLTSAFLTGIYHPLRNIPFPLSLLSNVLPARYFVDLSRDAFVRGAGWSGVWIINLILLLSAMLIFNAARRALSRMQLPD